MAKPDNRLSLFIKWPSTLGVSLQQQVLDVVTDAECDHFVGSDFTDLSVLVLTATVIEIIVCSAADAPCTQREDSSMCCATMYCNVKKPYLGVFMCACVTLSPPHRLIHMQLGGCNAWVPRLGPSNDLSRLQIDASSASLHLWSTNFWLQWLTWFCCSGSKSTKQLFSNPVWNFDSSPIEELRAVSLYWRVHSRLTRSSDLWRLLKLKRS